MTKKEAFDYLIITCEMFSMIPVIRAILVQVQARDLDGAYYAVRRALDDPRIQRAKPLAERLEAWAAAVTPAETRKAA